MTEFTLSTLDFYIGQGYSHILYYNMDHFAILVPCNSEPETNENSYALPIADDQIRQMACGDNEFSIYVLP